MSESNEKISLAKHKLDWIKQLMCYRMIPTNYTPYKQPISDDQLERHLAHYPIKSGRFEPKGCLSITKIAIIIPFKNNKTKLNTLIWNLHTFLVPCNIAYGIYVVKSEKLLVFNKSLLMNAGFIESLKNDDYGCFIFHDVDMFPNDKNVVYDCSNTAPKLIASSLSYLRHK